MCNAAWSYYQIVMRDTLSVECSYLTLIPQEYRQYWSLKAFEVRRAVAARTRGVAPLAPRSMEGTSL